MANDFYEAIYDGRYTTKLRWASHTQDPVACRAHKEDVCALEALFKTDLLAEYDVTNNPKADLCYAKAWDMGHANGLHEVAMYFEDLVGLIK